MLTLPIGLIAVFLVTFFSLDVGNLGIYANSHSAVIVGLGTIAVFLLSVPKKDILLTLKSLKDLKTRDNNNLSLKESLLNLSKNRKTDLKLSDLPLISYAQELWEQGIDKNNFEYLMNEKYDELYRLSERPVVILKNLAKYPPALGMTGTVMGMIALFANLTSDNKSGIGQALAVAMTATFYGLILANMILLPIADRVHVKHQYVSDRNEDILNALLKINNDEPVSIIEFINIEEKYYGQAG
jgi:chemotaxis protein MotA